MTVLEQVRDFLISHSPRAVCDDCIANKLKLRQRANSKTRELEKKRRFDRRIQVCSVCGKERKSISYAPRPDVVG